MKNLVKSWKFWVIVALIAAIVITAVVCHLKQPKVSYAYLEVASFVTFAIGCAIGAIIDNYVVKNKKSK